MSSSVYTKTGDQGTTGLYTGERVKKSSLRVEAYGTIDELQAFLGLARAYAKNVRVQAELLDIERSLWTLMADIASLNQAPQITDQQVKHLEKVIDRFDAKLEPLAEFILPGENKSSAYLHVSRTVARRAERDLWRVLDAGESVHESNLRYLNRLSDLCFILSLSLIHIYSILYCIYRIRIKFIMLILYSTSIDVCFY